MILSEIAILILVFLTFLWYLLRILINAFLRQSRKLPPGPRALPIIGNLHMLGDLPHRSLQNLAKKYGPIMSMRLGFIPTIVVSSPQAAELFLKTHDTIFASRPKLQAFEYLSYGTKAMAFSEYGPYWRHIRKLCTLQLLCPSKIEASAPLRREEVGLLVQSLKVAAETNEVVDLSEKVGELVEGITYRMVLGRKKDDMFDLKGIMEECMFLIGAFNISDYVPFLSPFDLQVCYPSLLITKLVTYDSHPCEGVTVCAHDPLYPCESVTVCAYPHPKVTPKIQDVTAFIYACMSCPFHCLIKMIATVLN
ncbi:hypothetical protein C1H46_033593 [Malus baccata]|uniref:Cytochrome P450 n=1 Tax=Malus baccata TaxID=106549 RepID=A0A540L2Y4_MALBA|nr:hypothetical protein C1H46_033593 [Malus baccata]